MNIKIDIEKQADGKKTLNFMIPTSPVQKLFLEFEKESLGSLDQIYSVIIENINDVILIKDYTTDGTTESLIADRIIYLLNKEIKEIKEYLALKTESKT